MDHHTTAGCAGASDEALDPAAAVGLCTPCYGFCRGTEDEALDRVEAAAAMPVHAPLCFFCGLSRGAEDEALDTPAAVGSCAQCGGFCRGAKDKTVVTAR